MFPDMTDNMRRRVLYGHSLKKAAALLSGLVLIWAILLTAVMLLEHPAKFHCGDASCSALEVARLFGRNAFVMLWLIGPYVVLGWAFLHFAPHLNRMMPRWLRWHPRWSFAMRIILGILLFLGQLAVAVLIYVMLTHNPQGEFCRHVNSYEEANFYPPCHIGLDELAWLVGKVALALCILLVPLAIIGWLFTVLAISLEHGRGRRWLGRRPFD